MNTKVAAILDFVFDTGVVLLVLLTPLVFWNLTTEFYETPKFLLLTLFVGIFLLLWVLKYLISGKITLKRTPLDLPFILLLSAFIVSTLFAASKSVAILGNIPRIHGGLASFAMYIILYFILTSNLKTAKITEKIIHALVLSGTILATLTLLAYFGKNILPLSWTSIVTFTPTGSSFSTAAILALLLPFPMIAILQNFEKETLGNVQNEIRKLATITGFKRFFRKIQVKQIINKIILSLILTLYLVTIALTGSLATFIGATASFVLVFMAISPIKFRKNLFFVILPLLLVIALMVFSFLPVGESGNFLQEKAKNFPRELQLTLPISWQVSASAFRDFPFWGSGPGSYLTDFTTYKPVEFNNLQIWNVRFDTAFNEYLHFLATLGVLGLMALLLLTIVFISSAVKILTSPRGSLDLALATSGIVFFVILALHASTVPLWVIGSIILAAFMVTQKKAGNETQIDSRLSTSFNTLPAIILIISVIVVGGLFYMTGKLALADFYHRQALDKVTQGRAVDAYDYLIRSKGLNPYIDLYRTDLAQTNFALANAIASAKGPASTRLASPLARGEPSEASPSGSLTDKDKQDIQTLLSQAINEGRAATILNPNSPVNWEILGSIYRQISGVAQNALAFALDCYGQAIKHDPANPLLRLTVGGIYYSVKNYDLAIRFFTDAVNLKPDYANGYYNLALAMKEKGDLGSAISFAQKTISLLEPTAPDYQKATELLADLKGQQASPSGDQQTTPALQDKNLPKVLDLPKPDHISTPEAVKKTPATPTP